VSYFNTAPKSGSLRAHEVNLQYHLTQCAAVFGKKMFPASVDMVVRYGGEFPRADKVFYSDFSDDPWQRASVWFSPSDSQPYHLAQCDNCGHCMDLHAPSETDPAPLVSHVDVLFGVCMVCCVVMRVIGAPEFRFHCILGLT